MLNTPGYFSNMNNKDLMTTGSIRKKLISFALPLFLGNLFQQLYNTADSLIVGNFVGKNALAAVSTAGNLIFMLIGFFNGIFVGAGVIIARFIGARDKENTERSVHTTVALGLLFSVLMTAIGIIFTPKILVLMSTPENVLPESISYFRVYFAGSTGFIMYNCLVGIMQASGDSRHPLHYLIMSSCINVALDLILIAGLGFGVSAAAFATAFSQVFSAILCLIRLVRTDTDVKIVLSHIRFDMKMVQSVIRYGLPSGLQNSIMSFSNVVIQSYINSYGEAAMAGIGAYVKVEGFIFIPITSFAMAITTFVSQNIGAGEYERTKKGIRFGLACALISAETLGVILFFFAQPLIKLFCNEPDVVFYGVQRAQIVTFFFFLCGLTHFMAAVMRGAGKPLIPMMVFLFCWCVARITILTVTDQFIHTIYTTYWVYPITWVLSSTAMLIFYRRLKFENTIK